MEVVYHAVIQVKLLLVVIPHVKYALITVLIVILLQIAPNAASILLLLLMDLALNADMDYTRLITILAKSVRPTVLTALIITVASIVLQDLALMELIIAGPVMCQTVSSAIQQIRALLVYLLTFSITPLILVIANILMSYWQIILASVLQEEVIALAAVVDVVILTALFVMKIQEIAQYVSQGLSSATKSVFSFVQSLTVLSATLLIIVKHVLLAHSRLMPRDVLAAIHQTA
jgi:hypothetical protein